jgi:hypothetical protein
MKKTISISQLNISYWVGRSNMWVLWFKRDLLKFFILFWDAFKCRRGR